MDCALIPSRSTSGCPEGRGIASRARLEVRISPRHIRNLNLEDINATAGGLREVTQIRPFRVSQIMDYQAR